MSVLGSLDLVKVVIKMFLYPALERNYTKFSTEFTKNIMIVRCRKTCTNLFPFWAK